MSHTDCTIFINFGELNIPLDRAGIIPLQIYANFTSEVVIFGLSLETHKSDYLHRGCSIPVYRMTPWFKVFEVILWGLILRGLAGKFLRKELPF